MKTENLIETEEERRARLNREFEEEWKEAIRLAEEEDRKWREDLYKKFEYYDNLPTIETTPESVNRFLTNYLENHVVDENLLLPDYEPENENK